MKKRKILFIMSNLLLLLISCKKEDAGEINFYNAEFRTGLWITADKSDTLNFVDKHKVIRNGALFSREEYTYNIEKSTLIIMAVFEGEEIRTQHPILNVAKNSVQLGNMYITTGAGDNSAIFFKN